MNRRRGYLLILLVGFIFSTTEVVLKILGTYFAPMQLTAERVLCGALAALPVVLHSCRKRGVTLTRGDWLYLAGIGFITVTVHMSFLQLAVGAIDASAASTLYSGSPIISTVLACLVLHEPLRKNYVAALGLMAIGIVLIVNPAHLEMSLRGFLYIMIATVAFGTYTTLCKLRMDRLGSSTIADLALLCGGLEMLALILLGRIGPVADFYRSIGLSLYAEVPLFTGFTIKSTLLMLYAGVVLAGGGFFLMAQITQDTSATEASFVYIVKPIIATLFAAAVLHEHISVSRMYGIAFFVAASLCISIPVLREMKKEKKEKELLDA